MPAIMLASLQNSKPSINPSVRLIISPPGILEDIALARFYPENHFNFKLLI
jgi:hypothetical protein